MSSPGQQRSAADAADTPTITNSLASFEGGLFRMLFSLLREHPELLHEDGTLDQEAVTRFLYGRLGDKAPRTFDEFLAVLGSGLSDERPPSPT